MRDGSGAAMEIKRLFPMLQVFALVLCRGVLPLVTVVFLLVMPSLGTRQLLAGSPIPDWIARILIAAFFCIHYWGLPRLFEPTPDKWLSVSADVLRDPALLKGYYLFLTLLYTAAAVLLTYFAISEFLPALHDARVIAASINGLIFIVAFALRYSAFKQLAANQPDNYSRG